MRLQASLRLYDFMMSFYSKFPLTFLCYFASELKSISRVLREYHDSESSRAEVDWLDQLTMQSTLSTKYKQRRSDDEIRIK